MTKAERRELDRKVGRDFLKLEGDALEKYVEHQEYLRRNQKEGDNIIHLQFNGLLLPERDVLDFERELTEKNLTLSYFDDSNSMSASLWELIATITVTAPVASWVISNVAWEVIWNFFLRTITMTSTKIKEFRSKNPNYLQNRKVGIGINFEIKGEKGKEHINFTVPADADPKVVKEAGKVMLKLVKEYRKGKRFEQWELDEKGEWNRDSNYDVPEY